MTSFLRTIDKLRTHKGRLLSASLALASIALAHYAGFAAELPLQIIASSGGAIAPGVTATFLFYVALSAVLARVAVGIGQPIFLLQLLIAERLGHGYKLSDIQKKRKFVRGYNNLLLNEGYLWLAVQLAFFVLFMFALYLDYTITWKTSLWVLGALAAIVPSALFRTRFLLNLNWRLFMRKLRCSSIFQANAASALFVAVATALVIASFFMGSMRMVLLKNAPPQQVTNQYFAGYAKLIASAGSSNLLFEERDGKRRYIYATSEFALSIESEPRAFPILDRR